LNFTALFITFSVAFRPEVTMLPQRHRWLVAAAVVLQLAVLAQSSRAQEHVALAQFSGSAAPPPIVSLTSVPVPDDPLELVTRDARQIQSAEERASTLDLLQQGHQRSNVRLHPYHLKASFTSFGLSSSDGRWILEDISPGPGIYRWTAEGPSFSGVFLNANKLMSSNRPAGAMPLRLAQVRDAMWNTYAPEIGPYATLRVANGYLNGVELRCVLVAHGIYRKDPPPFSSGRSFDEAEYCVNPQSGLLETYSPYAGLYVRYDYANGLHFHEQILPDGFTITQRGKTVIEAKIESVAEPPPPNSNLFEPAGLKPLGVGQPIVPMRIHGFQMSELLSQSDIGQVVVVHGMVSADGRLTEVEVLASTNVGLDQAAIEHASRAHALQDAGNRQPGTTPLSREAIFTVQFTPLFAPPGFAPRSLPRTGDPSLP
jgi:hypothetical protein